MLLEILTLEAVKNIFGQAKSLHIEIKQTEEYLNTATENFQAAGFNKSSVRKLIISINQSQTPLSNTFFRNNNGTIAISPTVIDASLDSQIRSILSPLVGKDIGTSSIENVKKKQITDLYNNELKPLGVKKPNFDKMLKHSYEVRNPLNYCFITSQGFIGTIQDKEEWYQSGGGGGPISTGREYFLTSDNQVALSDSDIFICGIRYNSPASIENGVRIFDLQKLLRWDDDNLDNTMDILSVYAAQISAAIFFNPNHTTEGSSGPNLPVSINKFSQQINPIATTPEFSSDPLSILNPYKIPEETVSRYKFLVGDKQLKCIDDFLVEHGFLGGGSYEYDATEEQRQIFKSLNFLQLEDVINLDTWLTLNSDQETFLPWESQAFSFPIYVLDTQTNTSYFWKYISFKLRYTPDTQPDDSCSSSWISSCSSSCGSSCGSSGSSSSGDLPDLSSISFDNLGSYYSIIGDVPSYATQEGNFTTIENNPDQTNLLYSGVSTYQLTLGLLGVQSDISNLTAYFNIYRMDSESGNILLVSTAGTIYQSDNLWKARTTITTSDGTLLSNTGNYAMEVYIQEELIGWVNFTVALP
jgi:hypothetical protein